MKKLFLSMALIFAAINTYADEGMWLLKELNRQSLAKMKQLGFNFPADKIYSENAPSIKDAVVIFGGGCTGVAVSDQGLIFTNHHCGYGSIQKLSAVEHDYLKDGFVSQTLDKELNAPGLTVCFLQKSEDVTSLVLANVTANDDEATRDEKIDEAMKKQLEKYKDDEFTRAQIIPFYSGNKYYLVVYEVFKDVRLAFTPPQSIGKFGGETDNWMWPRHTGDFSVFRVYANKENKAANYSADNVPYKPKYVVPISIKGYSENDYAMTIGYPGSTERYMSSWGITQMVESDHKPRIEVRGAKQEIWREAMNASDAIRIKYASKYAGSSNYWKNAMGMNESISKLGIISQKDELEKKFDKWVTSNSSKKGKYSTVLSSLKDAYTATMDIAKVRMYFNETFYGGIELSRFTSTYLHVMKEGGDNVEAELKSRLANTYKDYEPELDRKLMPVLLKLYAERVPAEYLPTIYQTIQEKFDGDYYKYADWFYDTTCFTSIEDVIKYAKTSTEDNAEVDPAIEYANSLSSCMGNIYKEMHPHMPSINKGSRLFMAGLMEMEPNKAFYPDANFTQRLSYGSIGGYKPADAVQYNYYSTPKGIQDKYVINDPEFHLQQYILDNLAKKDYGRYADKDGSMHVNFLSNNDITGGNSGSPVFDKNAQLIGLAFDGNWESLSGDITFEPELQRCISVDIRYVLYIMDKVMPCPRLIDEVTIAK